ncbi:hypothetical protein QI633_02955 [Nocardioides sp. QY071]|uniref:hypothetical protein n=1 Tax=Nocardioides sp. QY071 TaxID=3044187 RepID=UPI002499F96A|nr:hypothetical protein [Nocardioides sp. QY071]WGY02724.1 hypothetical protein QI633_02955 [Nocardioides sp. QY071]
MHPRALAAMAANGGLITRHQLHDLGIGPGQIRSMLRRRRGELEPRLRVLRRGIYTTTEIWNALDAYVGQPLLLARAAGLAAKRDWVLSHDSSCHLQKLPMLRPEVPLVHLTRPGWTNAWTEYGIKHHLARFAGEQVVVVDGLRALDLPRTAVDVAREHGFRHGLVACDAAMRRGVSRAEFWSAVEIMTNWPGVKDARLAVALADPGAESVLETLARELVIESGIGDPETQFPVRTTRGVAWCDLRVGNLMIEADGEVKYLDQEDGGLSSDPRQTWFDEKVRERAVTDRGLVVVRVVNDDIWKGRRRAEAIDRIRRANAEAVQRFGAEIRPELAREAEELRRQYGDRRSA